jgi:hypothetical protein
VLILQRSGKKSDHLHRKTDFVSEKVKLPVRFPICLVPETRQIRRSAVVLLFF